VIEEGAMRTVLRGGTVIDGTGGPRRRADVEIVDGRVTALGEVAVGADTEVVDVGDLVVCPGFVDVHTHLDAQVFWDPDLTPSSWHGVTTAIQGNCGFGIAPTRPSDRALVMDTLELVEGMNVRTLQAGIDWRFETFPEYLDVVAALPKRINLAAMVPHSMVRLYAMGPDAAFERAATAEERAEIKRLMVEALAAGAVGISTSQAPSHQGPHGRPVPSRLADRAEIAALCEALAEHGRGIAEITYGPVYEIEDIARLSTEHGVRITWGSVIPGLFGGPGSAMAMLDRGAAAGGDVWPQTSTRFITTQMSLKNPYQWSRVPAFAEIYGRSPDVMAKAYADPGWRERARTQTVSLAHQTDFLDGDIDGYFERTSVEETTHHGALRGIPLAQLARERSVHPLDLMLDLALEDDLETRFRNRSRGTREELRDLVTDRRTVLGAHDAGAHVDMLCDSCYPSWTLRHWVREEGAMSLEEAIWRMAGQPAELFGIPDRGVLAPGRVADVVAFDPVRIAETERVRVYDFPGDGDRLISRNVGIEHVWIAGQPIVQGNALVEGATPGELLRC
jgi:N-acyl-D-aspartate/D-glutamate deacylase